MIEDFPIFKKGEKYDPGKYRPVSHISMTDKNMEKTILGGTEEHLKGNTVISHHQHGFMRQKSCLLYLISFHDNGTHLTDQGKPVDVIFFNFSKGFDTVFLSIHLEKRSSKQLDKHIMKCVSAWLNREWGDVRLATCH